MQKEARIIDSQADQVGAHTFGIDHRYPALVEAKLAVCKALIWLEN